MKRIMVILFLVIFFVSNANEIKALEINFGDYGKDLKLVKALSEKIKKLRIYGKPELKKVVFRKSKNGKCDITAEYDKAINVFGSSEYLQTKAGSLDKCADELINYIKHKNYIYAVIELIVLGEKINGKSIEIKKVEGNDFPFAVAGEYLVKVAIAENEFEFFISNNDSDEMIYASTIEETRKYLSENIPERIEDKFIRGK